MASQGTSGTDLPERGDQASEGEASGRREGDLQLSTSKEVIAYAFRVAGIGARVVVAMAVGLIASSAIENMECFAEQMTIIGTIASLVFGVMIVHRRNDFYSKWIVSLIIASYLAYHYEAINIHFQSAMIDLTMVVVLIYLVRRPCCAKESPKEDAEETRPT